MRVPSLGREDPLEWEMVIHSSVLAWKIPWTEEPGGLQSMGSQSSAQLSSQHVGHSTFSFSSQPRVEFHIISLFGTVSVLFCYHHSCTSFGVDYELIFLRHIPSSWNVDSLAFIFTGCCCSLFSLWVGSDSLWLHGLQHARLPCSLPSPRVCSNSCPLSQGCHPTISSSSRFAFNLSQHQGLFWWVSSLH